MCEDQDSVNDLSAYELLMGPCGGRPKLLNGEAVTYDRGWTFNWPDLLIWCDDDICKREMIFTPTQYMRSRVVSETERPVLFARYACKHCGGSLKTIVIELDYDEAGRGFRAVKFGELPLLLPETHPELLRLFSASDRTLYLTGRRAEHLGYGIGAFAYYRRVVESVTARLFDDIIRVAKLSKHADAAALEVAKRQFSYSGVMDDFKSALPESVLVSGHNPLALLHSALSDGLHERSDEECLQLAKTIRLVLGETVERITNALRDDAALSAAVGKLTRTGTAKDARAT